jgi:hypothetical protein
MATKAGPKSVQVLTYISPNTLQTCLRNHRVRAIRIKKTRAFYFGSSRIREISTCKNHTGKRGQKGLALTRRKRKITGRTQARNRMKKRNLIRSRVQCMNQNPTRATTIDRARLERIVQNRITELGPTG